MEIVKNSLTASLARGVLWCLLTVVARSGIKDTIDSKSLEATALALAQIVVAAGIGLISLWWSKKSATKLLNTTPPTTPTEGK